MPLLNILGFAALAHLAADFITHIDTNNKLAQKPFKCDLCLGFWLSIVPNIIVYGVEAPLYSALSAVAANLIYKYT